ncbi:MAG: glycerophosphodiester phosphodiesterase [Verrucomicrobia bacterium]|nr:glycerophosphodiester phosphodiesterase [Cytophagales bacterium]
MKLFSLFFTFSILFSLHISSQNFDIQGHRGCRGLLPENSLPAFLKAIDIEVNTLELDVVVSKDGKLVVSHEPWLGAEICLDKNGKPIEKAKETSYNLYQMAYAAIKKCDCGSLGNKRFPEQVKIKIYKPLLSKVFKQTQAYLKKKKLPSVRYNIETKCSLEGDDIFHPKPAIFAKKLYDQILANKMENFVSVQSFDVRTLQEFKKFSVKIPLVLLVENEEGIEKNIAKLGFQPQVYSPYFRLIDQNTLDYCQKYNIALIPWTVNEIADMEVMQKLNLSGIITDFPDRAVKVFRKK